MTDTSELSLLQAALAAEDAIIYGYGIVGARLPEDDQAEVMDIWDAHRLRRDGLSALVRVAGGVPIAPSSAYALPFAVHDAADARRLAGHLEDGGAGAAWDLIAGSPSDSDGRSLAVAWLTASGAAVAQLTDRPPAALPGAPPKLSAPQ